MNENWMAIECADEHGRFPIPPARRILVADDEPALRRMVADVLRRAGYTVDAVEDGQSAWEAISSGHYDLIVTDHDMPRLTGRQLIRRLRYHRVKVPVILASGAVDLGGPEDYRDLALNAVLQKPFSLSAVVSAVHNAIHQPAPQAPRPAPSPIATAADAAGLRLRHEPSARWQANAA